MASISTPTQRSSTPSLPRRISVVASAGAPPAARAGAGPEPSATPQAQAAGHGARAAWVMVVLIAIHSLDEYPLWYAYFLLPAAWAWGFALGSGPAPARAAGGAPAEATTLIRLGSE